MAGWANPSQTPANFDPKRPRGMPRFFEPVDEYTRRLDHSDASKRRSHTPCLRRTMRRRQDMLSDPNPMARGLSGPSGVRSEALCSLDDAAVGCGPGRGVRPATHSVASGAASADRSAPHSPRVVWERARLLRLSLASPKMLKMDLMASGAVCHGRELLGMRPKTSQIRRSFLERCGAHDDVGSWIPRIRGR